MARRRLVLVSENCGILNWPDLAPGVYAMAPDEDLLDAIFRISRKSLSERLEKAETGHQAAARFNHQTVRQWVDLLARVAGEALK
ncbi:MAG: hypothetical protein ACLFRF_09960 [Desulfobacterales bacterium]